MPPPISNNQHKKQTKLLRIKTGYVQHTNPKYPSEPLKQMRARTGNDSNSKLINYWTLHVANTQNTAPTFLGDINTDDKKRDTVKSEFDLFVNSTSGS